MKNYVESKIETISRITTVEIPALVKTPDVTEMSYAIARVNLNQQIIEALTGGEIIFADKEGKKNTVKFRHSLPTKNQLLQIYNLVGAFIRDVETPFFERLANITAASNEDDMSVPEKQVNTEADLLAVEKMNNKTLKAIILGTEGNGALTKTFITASDCIAIAAAAEDAHKRANRKKMFAIGGVMLAVAGIGAAVAVMANSKKDDKAKDVDADVDADLTDISDVDIDTDVDPELDDTTPVVELDNLVSDLD